MEAEATADLDKPLDQHGRISAAALDRFLKTVRERSEAFLAELETAPQRKPCPQCNGEQVLRAEESRERMAYVYHCATCADHQAQRELGERIERAGIPSDVRHATLDNFQLERPNISPRFQNPATFLDAARAFLAGTKRNIILAGTPGIGKGHLAAAIAIAFLKAGKRARWVECARLFKSYHQAYASDTTEAIVDSLGALDLLVLDEVCMRDLPADGEEILFEVLDRRHKRAAQTVLLANRPAAAIRDWLGGRVADRLKSGGYAFCYGEWDSMRGSQFDGAVPSVDGFEPFKSEQTPTGKTQ